MEDNREAAVAAAAAGASGAADAAGAPAEAGPDPTELLLQTLLEEPYSNETLNNIGVYYRRKAVYPDIFVYTTTGDLEVKEAPAPKETKKKRAKFGTVDAGIIQLKRYIPLEAEERAALENWRAERLAQAEADYEEGMTALRGALTAFKEAEANAVAAEELNTLKMAVVSANKRVNELSIKRDATRSAVRQIEYIDNPTANQILLGQPKETRKLFKQDDAFLGELVRMMYYDFPAALYYGKYVPDEAAPAAEAAAAEDAEGIRAEEAGFRKKLKDGRIARVFFDPKKSPVNNFLSPLWAARLVIRETQYNFPLQAYEAERAKELNKVALQGVIMRSTSAQTIRLATRKETGHPADARGLWLEIYTAMYQQNPALKEQLLATGTDALVYADPREGPSGVGVDEDSPDVLDPTKWAGENVVGTVQETLRTQMREETMAEAPVGAINEHAITEEEAEARRVGAIVNAARRRNGAA